MTMGKPKLSREASERLDDHARKTADAMRRATAHRGSPARANPYDDGASHARHQPKSRRGKKAVVIYLSGEAKDLYAQIAADKRLTAQDLGTLAINLMFEHFRHKRIA